MKHIAVIIVNYKTGTLVAESLGRLAAARSGEVDLKVVVVDNQSPDDSVDVIRRAIDQLSGQTWIDLVAHGHNGGFAAGNNVGFRRVTALNWPVDHYFLLNPDASIQADTLPELLGFMERLARPAVLGCVQINEAGAPRPSSFRFPSLASEFQRGASLGMVERIWPHSRVALPVPTQPEPADWVTGAAFLLPKPIVDQVGLMDEGFFLYYEEVAYMHQIRAAGHEIWCVPSAKITHIAGASTGIVTGRAKARRMPIYWYRSWRRYFMTIHGSRSMWACGLAWLAGHAIHRILSLVVSRRRTTGGPSSVDFIRYALLNRPDT